LSEGPMESVQGSCKIILVKDAKLGWKIIADGDCREMEKVIKGLPLRKKEYLRRRVDYVNRSSDFSVKS